MNKKTKTFADELQKKWNNNKTLVILTTIITALGVIMPIFNGAFDIYKNFTEYFASSEDKQLEKKEDKQSEKKENKKLEKKEDKQSKEKETIKPLPLKPKMNFNITNQPNTIEIGIAIINKNTGKLDRTLTSVVANDLKENKHIDRYIIVPQSDIKYLIDGKDLIVEEIKVPTANVDYLLLGMVNTKHDISEFELNRVSITGSCYLIKENNEINILTSTNSIPRAGRNKEEALSNAQNLFSKEISNKF